MPIDFEIHQNIMLQILKDIYSDTHISPFLGFKGGTCVHFLYGLDRFSVDLDFDLLNSDQESVIFESLKGILSQYGTLKDARKKRYSLFFLLSYGASTNLKVEINLREFGSHYEIKNYLGISFLAMERQDIFAHKMVAMEERLGKTNRDIYDVWFFLKNQWPINKEIVEKRVNLPFKDYLEKCIQKLEKMSNRNILNGIGELLNVKQKTWVKANLLKDTIFLLKVMLHHSNL